MSVEFQGILEKLEATRLTTIFLEISEEEKRECRKIEYNIKLKYILKKKVTKVLRNEKLKTVFQMVLASKLRTGSIRCLFPYLLEG